MRLLRRGTHRKTSPIGVPPIKTRGRPGKTQRKARLWCLILNLSGRGIYGGDGGGGCVSGDGYGCGSGGGGRGSYRGGGGGLSTWWWWLWWPW